MSLFVRSFVRSFVCLFVCLSIATLGVVFLWFAMQISWVHQQHSNACHGIRKHVGIYIYIYMYIYICIHTYIHIHIHIHMHIHIRIYIKTAYGFLTSNDQFKGHMFLFNAVMSVWLGQGFSV